MSAETRLPHIKAVTLAACFFHCAASGAGRAYIVVITSSTCVCVCAHACVFERERKRECVCQFGGFSLQYVCTTCAQRYAHASFMLRILNPIWHVHVRSVFSWLATLVFRVVTGFIVWKGMRLRKGNGKRCSSPTSPTPKQETQSQ